MKNDVVNNPDLQYIKGKWCVITRARNFFSVRKYNDEISALTDLKWASRELRELRAG